MRLRTAWRPTGLRGEHLQALLSEDLPATAADGGAIRAGADAELETLRGAGSSARAYLAALEATERERTGIRSLRVGYNRVFGYYIEVPNAQRDRVPDDYSRKQTLAGGERFVTPDLKEHEEIVLHARDRAIAREVELLNAAATRVAAEARALADVLDWPWRSWTSLSRLPPWRRSSTGCGRRSTAQRRCGSSAAVIRSWSARSGRGASFPTI